MRGLVLVLNYRSIALVTYGVKVIDASVAQEIYVPARSCEKWSTEPICLMLWVSLRA